MGYRWNQPAYSLSYANRRRLEIARAMATAAIAAMPVGGAAASVDEAGAGAEPFPLSVMLWTVVAPTNNLGEGSLAGHYGGATASDALGGRRGIT